jgi:hypothetical protein
MESSKFILWEEHFAKGSDLGFARGRLNEETQRDSLGSGVAWPLTCAGDGLLFRALNSNALRA